MASKTNTERTRNDKYLIMKQNEKNDKVVSYAKNLIKKINADKLLGNEISDSCLEDDAQFRELINKLDKAGYSVYQLTRL